MAFESFNFRNTLIYLDQVWGLRDVLLPFLLVFVIIFAVLQKARILGEDKKRYNVIVALVIALLVVIPHVLGIYPPNADVVEIMNNSIPQVSLIAVAVIMLLILIGLFGGESKWMGSSLSGWIAIAAFIVVLVIFGGAAGWWDWNWINFYFGPDTISVVVMILVFAIIIWWITRTDTADKQANAVSNIGKWVGDMFKPK